jgi:hypothetical protein
MHMPFDDGQQRQAEASKQATLLPLLAAFDKAYRAIYRLLHHSEHTHARPNVSPARLPLR